MNPMYPLQGSYQCLRTCLLSSHCTHQSITSTRSLTLLQVYPAVSLHVANLATVVARDVGLLALFLLPMLWWLPLYHTQVHRYRPLLLLALSWWFLLLLWLLLSLMVLGAHLCPALNVQLQPVLKGSVSGLLLRYGPSNQR